MNETRRKHKREPELSSQAQRLLGHLVTLADYQGVVEVTRTELANALRVSIPTIARGLRELWNAGELKLIKPGGGRGHASRYRITRFSRERVPARPARADVAPGQYPKPRDQIDKIIAKPDHTDPDLEPDLHSEAIRALAADLGQTIVTGAAACLQGAVKAWRGLSTWQRATLAGLPLGALGILMGRRYAGKLGAAIGGGAGLLAGAAFALLVPPEERAAEAPADRPTSPEARELATDHSLIGYLARQASQN